MSKVIEAMKMTNDNDNVIILVMYNDESEEMIIMKMKANE